MPDPVAVGLTESTGDDEPADGEGVGVGVELGLSVEDAEMPGTTVDVALLVPESDAVPDALEGGVAVGLSVDEAVAEDALVLLELDVGEGEEVG